MQTRQTSGEKQKDREIAMIKKKSQENGRQKEFGVIKNAFWRFTRNHKVSPKEQQLKESITWSFSIVSFIYCGLKI